MVVRRHCLHSYLPHAARRINQSRFINNVINAEMNNLPVIPRFRDGTSTPDGDHKFADVSQRKGLKPQTPVVAIEMYVRVMD